MAARRPYLSTWREVLQHGRPGRCFPSGHASSGYALVATYFFCRCMAPRLRRYAFGTAMALGLAFGIAQQLRGAHYLSHDVWALAICWFVAVAATPILRWDTRHW
jgi:membrane-associated PAP2 superfamily phosphatase